MSRKKENTRIFINIHRANIDYYVKDAVISIHRLSSALRN